MINVICIDGASASIRKKEYRCRPYFSDVVYRTVYTELIRTKYDQGYAFNSMRGSVLNSKKRECRKEVQNYDLKGNDLLICGKSTGAKVVADVLNELYPLNYRRICAVFVDADWIWRRARIAITGKERVLKIPELYALNNYYQLNQDIGGGRLHSTTPRQLTELISEPDITHWNIINHPSVEAGIKQLLGYLINEK